MHEKSKDHRRAFLAATATIICVILLCFVGDNTQNPDGDAEIARLDDTIKVLVPEPPERLFEVAAISPENEGDPSTAGVSRMLAQTLPKVEEIDRPIHGWGGSRLDDPILYPKSVKELVRSDKPFKLNPDDGRGRKATDAPESNAPFEPFPNGENNNSPANPFLFMDRALQGVIEPDARLRPDSELPKPIDVEYLFGGPNVYMQDKKTKELYILLMGSSFLTEKKPYFLKRKVLIEMAPPGSPQRVWLAIDPSKNE